MEEDRDYVEEEGRQGEDDRKKRRPHKGGRILRLEPTNTNELRASPMTDSCFDYVGCLDFCNMIKRVQRHPMLNRVFISNLRYN